MSVSQRARIRMSDDEVASFLERGRTATISSSVFERYERAHTGEMRPLVEQMMNKRVVIRIDPAPVRSWDHRKLGLASMPVAGSTAPYR